MRKRIITLLAIATMTGVAILNALPGSAQGDIVPIRSFRIESFPLPSNSPLTFLGGLELGSTDERFGGFSGIRITRSGNRLLTVSDGAQWLAVDLRRDENGRLSGVSDGTFRCLCRPDGSQYGSKHWGDSEALEINGNKAIVAFERLNRINEYDLDGDDLPSNPRTISPRFKPLGIGYNTGLESVALAPSASPVAGKFVAIAEESLNSEGKHRAFIVDTREIREFAIEASEDFAVTDAAFLENGDLLILERKFGWQIGLHMRIRKLPGQDIKAGATLDGPVLAQASLIDGIDNMEGLAAWKNAKGETILTLISDDNFRGFQRTILLEFKLN